MQLYNTRTQKKEEFIPHEAGKVKMYTCGPTVYHYAHIGNLRSYIMEDMLEKALRYLGYDVTRAMNITDVGHLSSDADTGEDKMLKGARREHKTVMQIAQFYTDAFFSDCEKLGIKRPEIVVPATSCIDTFIHMVEVLLEKGYAYIAGGNVYFDTSKLENYYVFGNMEEESLAVGVRDSVEEDETSAPRATSYCGLQSRSLTTRSSNGIPRGAWATRAGTSSAAASASSTSANTSTFTAAALITRFRTTRTRLHRAKRISATRGANTGSTCCTFWTRAAR